MRIREGRLVHSPSDLATFLDSPFGSWMDRLACETARGDSPYARDPEDELRHTLAKHGDVHERAVLSSFEARGLEILDIKAAVNAAIGKDASNERYALGLELTHDALERGVDVVFQAVLELDGFAGYPDFLVRRDGESHLGDHHYEVRDAKLARSTKPTHLLQLCCYAEMLHAVQGRHAADIVVVTAGQDGERTPLVDCFAWYRAVKRSYLAVQAAFDPRTPPDPARSRSLRRWSGVAGEMLDAVDHPSRVATITRREIDRLAGAGITTMRGLAEAGGRAVSGIDERRMGKLVLQATLQHERAAAKPQPEGDPTRPRPESGSAKLPLEGAPPWRFLNPEEPSARGLDALPAPTPHDLFFDLEGYPLEEDGLEYLWGCTYRDDAGERAFRHWWAHDRDGERAAFEGFVRWAHERWQRSPALHVYHYGHYEIGVLNRLAARFGTFETELGSMLQAEVFVDLYTVVRHAFVIGEPRYSLKNVERLYRARRETTLDNAADSITRYELARTCLDQGSAESQAEGARVLNGILDYNRDDCESTEELVGWLGERVTDLANERGDTSRFEQPGNDPRVAEPDRAVAAGEEGEPNAHEALLARLAARAAACEATGDTAGANWFVTLAGIVGHGARETRVAWREHHERMRMTDDELFDDAECIAYCRRTARAPWQVGGQQHRHYEYRFDAEQPLKSLPGSDKYAATVVVRSEDAPDGLLEATVTIPESDAASGLLALKSGASLPEIATLVPKPPFMRSQRQQAIDELVTRIESGAGEPQGLLDVLRRRRPRIEGHAGGPLLDPRRPACEQLDAIIALVVGLDDSALVIQGPPGCGKTWTAARVIARLLEDGCRVAVSSNSHAAIGNLVGAAVRVCDERAVAARFACVDDRDGALARAGVVLMKNGELGEWLSGGTGDVQAGVVGATVHGLSRADLAGAFDYLFVDEAGQVSVADLTATSRCARNLVLVGDQMQLGQPTRASHPGESGLSALDYIVDGRATVAPDEGILLDTSFRMHPRINDFIGTHVYEGQLKAASGNRLRVVHVPSGERSPIDEEAGVVWVPVEHEGCRQDSAEEAEAVIDVVRRLVGRTLVTDEGERPLRLDDILFVTPYNMQVRRLQRVLDAAFGSGARVGTVDRFQGQEAAVAVISLCASDASESARGLSFLLDRRRLNVAISRARTLAVVVSHPSLPVSSAASVAQVRQINFVAAASQATEQSTAPL